MKTLLNVSINGFKVRLVFKKSGYFIDYYNPKSRRYEIFLRYPDFCRSFAFAKFFEMALDAIVQRFYYYCEDEKD